jgi:hypothetical protein
MNLLATQVVQQQGVDVFRFFPDFPQVKRRGLHRQWPDKLVCWCRGCARRISPPPDSAAEKIRTSRRKAKGAKKENEIEPVHWFTFSLANGHNGLKPIQPGNSKKTISLETYRCEKTAVRKKGTFGFFLVRTDNASLMFWRQHIFFKPALIRGLGPFPTLTTWQTKLLMMGFSLFLEVPISRGEVGELWGSFFPLN